MDIVYSLAQASVQHGTQIVRLQIGQAWAANDAFVAARPDLFSAQCPVVHRTTPAGVVAEPQPPVERASAKPGERRFGARGR